MRRVLLLLVLWIGLPLVASAQTNTCDDTSVELYFAAAVQWQGNTPCVSYEGQEPSQRSECYAWWLGEPQPNCDCPNCQSLHIEVQKTKSAKIFFTFTDSSALSDFRAGVCGSDPWNQLDVFDFDPTSNGLEIVYPQPDGSDRCTDFDFCFRSAPCESDGENCAVTCGGDPTLVTKSIPPG